MTIFLCTITFIRAKFVIEKCLHKIKLLSFNDLIRTKWF